MGEYRGIAESFISVFKHPSVTWDLDTADGLLELFVDRCGLKGVYAPNLYGLSIYFLTIVHGCILSGDEYQDLVSGGRTPEDVYNQIEKNSCIGSFLDSSVDDKVYWCDLTWSPDYFNDLFKISSDVFTGAKSAHCGFLDGDKIVENKEKCNGYRVKLEEIRVLLGSENNKYADTCALTEIYNREYAEIMMDMDVMCGWKFNYSVRMCEFIMYGSRY